MAEALRQLPEGFVLDEPGIVITGNTGRRTPEGRPILTNNQGGFSTELTVTVPAPEGGFMVIPSIFGGEIVSEEQAAAIINQNQGIDPETGRPVGVFGTIEEANSSAKQRSESLSGQAAVPEAVAQAPTGLPEGFVLDTAEVVAEPESPGFIERVTSDVESRQKLAQEIKGFFEAGDQTFAESVLQLTGKVGAGTILDFLGEAVISGVEGLSAITPDIIEDPLIESATKAAHLFLETDIGKAGLGAAQAGMEAWNEFRAENPRAARNIESVVDIGLLIAPVKGKPKIKAQPTLAGKAATKLTGMAEAQTARQKADFVDELILPKQTAAVRVEQTARTTEEGILRSKKVAPSPAERIMADEVSLIKGVGAGETIQGNLNIIEKAVSDETARLISVLKKNEVIIPRREFAAEMDRAILRLEKNPLLVGDASTTATKVVATMKEIVASNPGTASGLLKSRKELDKWIKTQRPPERPGKPTVFDPDKETALSLALREVRQSTNDFIDERAVSVAVKDSLKKQSTLLRAMDNIAPKAADEANNAILRGWQSANKILGLRGEFNQTMAALFGLGGLGASAMFAPMFTKLALGTVVTYGAGKAILSPTAKKGVSKLLGVVDKAIRTSKDEALVTQLRLDRAAMVELLKDSNE